MDMTTIGEFINLYGLSITISIIAIYITLDSYTFWKKKISVQLDKQDMDIQNVKHCSLRTVETLELMATKQETRCGECRDFQKELEHKLLNGAGR